MARNGIGGAAAAGLLLVAGNVSAQYSLTATPYQNGGYSYYSNFNLGWSLSGRGWGFQWNGGNTGPQFGGRDPNSDAQFGGAFGGGPFSGGFRLTAGQGADTTMTSQTASVTVPNGGYGFFSDTTIRPFVTGIVPVVGTYTASPLQEKVARLQAQQTAAGPASVQASAPEPPPEPESPRTPSGGFGVDRGSSAARGDLSVAEIRAGQTTAGHAQEQELNDIFSKAKEAEQRGKPEIARIYYRQALRRVELARRAEVEAKLQALEAAR